jgi:hypothetical protein
VTPDVRSAVIAVGGLCSIADLARRWGVSRQAAAQTVRKPGFPEPILSEGNIELWPADEADDFRSRNQRSMNRMEMNR